MRQDALFRFRTPRRARVQSIELEPSVLHPSQPSLTTEMAAPPPKRRRVDTTGKPELGYADGILYCVKALPVPTLREILQTAALNHKDVAVQVAGEAARFVRSQQTTTVDFDYLSKDVWTASM